MPQHCVFGTQFHVRTRGKQRRVHCLARLAERAGDYVARALPGLHPEPVEPRHCWVTDLPWSTDGIAVWESAGIFFVAGHNLFKHAPWLGRALAGAALGDGLPGDLRPAARLGEPA